MEFERLGVGFFLLLGLLVSAQAVGWRLCGFGLPLFFRPERFFHSLPPFREAVIKDYNERRVC